MSNKIKLEDSDQQRMESRTTSNANCRTAMEEEAKKRKISIELGRRTLIYIKEYWQNGRSDWLIKREDVSSEMSSKNEHENVSRILCWMGGRALKGIADEGKGFKGSKRKINIIICA